MSILPFWSNQFVNVIWQQTQMRLDIAVDMQKSEKFIFGMAKEMTRVTNAGTIHQMKFTWNHHSDDIVSMTSITHASSSVCPNGSLVSPLTSPYINFICSVQAQTIHARIRRITYTCYPFLGFCVFRSLHGFFSLFLFLYDIGCFVVSSWIIIRKWLGRNP